MNWGEVIIALISAVAGGGVVNLLTIRQQRRIGNANAKGAEIDASSKQNDEWQEIVAEYKNQAKEVRELRQEVTELTHKVNRLYTSNSITLRYFCDKVNCPKRKPPFGTATEEMVMELIKHTEQNGNDN